MGLYLFLLFVPQEVLKLAELVKANSFFENLFMQSFLLGASELYKTSLKHFEVVQPFLIFEK